MSLYFNHLLGSIATLTAVISKNLRVLYLTKHAIKGAAIRILVDVLRGHPSLEMVDLYDAGIDVDAGQNRRTRNVHSLLR